MVADSMSGMCGVLQAIEVLIERLAGGDGDIEQLQDNGMPVPSTAHALAAQECQAAPGLACPASVGPVGEQCPHSQQVEESAEGRPSCDVLPAGDAGPCTSLDTGVSALGQGAEGSSQQGAALHEGDREQQEDVAHAGEEASSKKRKPARNRECPCGSGKRYKNCCGPVQAAAARRVADQEHEQCTVSHAMTALYV